ncbi:MAG: hydroxymethylglutaryl-CoA reductase, degradative [Anaerolineaceae bacterium]|nr:hydroxymethylglutaryl-CoA reductase, degradative [Anaerolineaceae bacterium]
MEITEMVENPTKFYHLTLQERREVVARQAGMSEGEVEALSGQTGLTAEQADHMIENAVGTFGLPLGIAQNFRINGEDVLIPMAIEEPSVVAGASFMARLSRSAGGFHAQAGPPEMIGQMQVMELADLAAAREVILAHKSELLGQAAGIDPVLQRLGGGPRDVEVRTFLDSPAGPFLAVHLVYDVRDAMGANAVNTAVERLAPSIEALTGGRVHLRILSNLADRRLARAEVTIRLAELAFGQYSAETVRDGILAAWAFAAVDPYRAATHNKGIMNGVDAVVIATGNDWRAIEAGAHAYAARSGRYTSLSTWGKDAQGNLVGSVEMPMAVGIVGGATKVHPGARMALKMMKVTSAGQLAEVIVSVGLAQNLAALRALATEGIQRGHMSLHARQVAVAAGAVGGEVDRLAEQLVSEGAVRSDRAEEILRKWSGA